MINLYGQDFYFSVDCEKAVEQLQAELATAKEELGDVKAQRECLKLSNRAFRGDFKEQERHLKGYFDRLITANEENKRLREALDGSSRIVEKYKDACMEWAKESRRKGTRQNKEFWERRAKSMANLLIMNQQALKEKP